MMTKNETGGEMNNFNSSLKTVMACLLEAEADLVIAERHTAQLEEQLRKTVPHEEFMAAVSAGVETGRKLRQALRRIGELEAELLYFLRAAQGYRSVLFGDDDVYDSMARRIERRIGELEEKCQSE